jgi:hypothetical protein
VAIVIEEGTDCYCCGEGAAVVLCRGCGIPLCDFCVKLEEYGYGCDSGKIVAFCPDCFSDPSINTVIKY